MQINDNNYSIMELLGMLERRELVINQEYQRGSGLWPLSARAFFIDTIMESFPFPKIYMYEYLERPARGIMREIVDGQQRINAIVSFYNNEFPLQADGINKGKRFEDLDEEDQDRFLSYNVSVDVIRNASRAEILQMFRRMNAYTMPLNDAEKRHSSFHGAFKWFVNELADELNEFFVEFGVFTTKQITRMGDAALISDWILALERGVISTSASDLAKLYDKYDGDYPDASRHREIILNTVSYITQNFGNLRKSHMMKPYALHSLFTALSHCRYEITPIQMEWNTTVNHQYTADAALASRSLGEMAAAHEGKETEGPYAKYVWGCLSTVDRRPRRTARVAAILRVLGADVPEDVDAKLT